MKEETLGSKKEKMNRRETLEVQGDGKEKYHGNS